jgi:hypothetical protein
MENKSTRVVGKMSYKDKLNNAKVLFLRLFTKQANIFFKNYSHEICLEKGLKNLKFALGQFIRKYSPKSQTALFF